MARQGTNWAICGRFRPVDRSERCQSTFFQEHQSLQVVACRLELQGEGDTDDTHAAHQLAAHLRQRAEHVFDTRAWCGDTAVALLLCIGDAFGGAAFALDIHASHLVSASPPVRRWGSRDQHRHRGWYWSGPASAQILW